MKIVFTVEVGVKVENYAEAGEKLDQITKCISEVVGDNGAYDVSSFLARHKSLDEFRYGDQNMAQPQMAEPSYDPMPTQNIG